MGKKRSLILNANCKWLIKKPKLAMNLVSCKSKKKAGGGRRVRAKGGREERREKERRERERDHYISAHG